MPDQPGHDRTLEPVAEPAVVHVDGLRWVVVRTKPRCEKKFDHYCQAREITCYLPLRPSVRRYHDRVAEFLVPLFSGYAFCQVAPMDTAPVNQSQHVAQILMPDETMEAQLITELQSVQTLMRAAELGEIEVRPEIQVGNRVTIRSGPMQGLTGVVTRRKNKTRLTVNVEMVGHSVSLEADAAEVELDV